MKTLIAYPFHTEVVANSHLIYLPDIVKLGEEALQSAILQYKPNIIVVGNNIVSYKTLNLWRNQKHFDDKLIVIRRGTSLAGIDDKGIKEFNVELINTPVNAPFVAEYILQNLGINISKTINQQTLAVIGTGKIGARVAKYAAEKGYNVIIYSPSLAQNSNETKDIIKAKALDLPNIQIANTAKLAVLEADLIAIAIDAKQVTDASKLDEEFVDAIKDKTFILSVSENRVFTVLALKKLINRAKQDRISLFIDSTPKDIGELKILAGGLNNNLNFVSKAMQTEACQKTMDQAVLVSIAACILKNNDWTKSASINNNKEIIIIGAGINGLINALVLKSQGYSIKIIDAIPDPKKNPSLVECADSTSWQGCNARHASLTETLPHASMLRADVLKRGPLKGGWLLKNHLNAEEKQWVNQFEFLAQFSELYEIFMYFVACINFEGLSIWKNFFESYPGLLKDTVQCNNILRLYKSATNLADGFNQQFKVHYLKNNNNYNIKELSKEQIQNAFPQLNISNITGGVEVDGFILSIYTLCANLKHYLEEQGVEFSWDNEVREVVKNGSKVHIKLSEAKHEDITADVVLITAGHNAYEIVNNKDIAAKVQGVIGFWLTLPNVSKFTKGFKIHEEEPIGVINVSISPDKKEIYFSGGFGYIGQSITTASREEIKNLSEKLREKAKEYLPEDYEAAVKAGTLVQTFCTRPMTANGIPVMYCEEDPAQIIYLSGTNSGGFVQAPILAYLVSKLLADSEEDRALIRNIMQILK